jgi:hypothetical protein
MSLTGESETFASVFNMPMIGQSLDEERNLQVLENRVPDGERLFQKILSECSRLLAMFHV